MEWPEARRYDEVIFDPSRSGNYDGKFNLWQGWMVEPEEGNDDAKWWDVLAAACGYNDDYIDYVSKWFADIIQNPTRKPGTGRQGIGKSALVETVGMLMSTINRSDNTAAIRGAYGDFDLDELLAEYNEHVANKLLVYLEEATWGGSHPDVFTPLKGEWGTPAKGPLSTLTTLISAKRPLNRLALPINRETSIPASPPESAAPGAVGL